MFSRNRKASKTAYPKTKEINIIAKSTLIKGDIISDGYFRMDGCLEGQLQTQGSVIIGPDSTLKGVLKALNVAIEGSFYGQLNVDEMLTLKAKSTTSGDVIVGKLSIEQGAIFNANCITKVKKPKEKKKEKKEEKKVVVKKLKQQEPKQKKAKKVAVVNTEEEKKANVLIAKLSR
jgi:cytoskeletal protein CcmA (bactofilin family)